MLTDDLDMGAITKRYGRGPDVKLAIEAGNDLAMICHQTDTADTAAKALEELPHRILDEALERVERFRKKKLKPPLPWSDQNWHDTCSALEKLAADFPETQDSGATSPVADY